MSSPTRRPTSLSRARPTVGPDASPAIRELAGNEALADDLAEFLGPSAYVPLADESAAVAEAILAEDPETSALAFLTRAADHVRARLEFRVGATTVESSVAEVLAGGSGVCQDFAHVLISLCRHAGLPARYVSGYLGGVAVASASHAWAEAYIPPYGWLGVDATLGTPARGDTSSWAWDATTPTWRCCVVPTRAAVTRSSRWR